MPYSIRKVGSKYCLYLKDGGKKLGCHDTKAEAEAQRSAIEMRKHASRNVVLRGATGEIRTAVFEGRERVVVPIVALVEGVIWPINAEGPEFVPAETIAMVPQGWNGRPVFADLGHPVNEEGEQVSGNTPRLLENAIGTVFNARTDGKRLLMEAWLDPDKPNAKEVLARVNSGRPVEVSVGAFVIEEDAPGVFGGKKYDSIWRAITPDHLALLPEGDEGACSVAMGCGIRAATVHLITAEGNVSYQTADDYKSMMEGLGEEFLQAHLFTHCMDVIIPAIHKKGGSVDDPNAFCAWWKQENSMANPKAMKKFEDLVRKSLDAVDPLKEVHAFGDGVTVYETASGKTYRQGYEQKGDVVVFEKDRIEVEPVVYYEPVDVTAAKGARHSAADMAKIQGMHDYAVELGAQCAPKTMAAKPCGCQDKENEMVKRTKEQREELVKTLRAKVCPKVITRLDALAKGGSGDLIDAIIGGIKDKLKLSDAAAADLANLEESTLVELAGMAAPEAPAPKDEGEGTPGKDGKEGDGKPPVAGYTGAEGKPRTETPPKPKTTEEWLSDAPQEVKDLVADSRAREATRKADLIKVLKSAQTEYTEAELKEKPVKELERLVRACKANAPVVDFGANAPRAGEGDDTPAPAPINLQERILANRAKK